MRSTWMIAAALSWVLCMTTAAGTLASPEGHWEGSIRIPGSELGVVIDLTEDESAWKGSIDIPAQNAKNLALSPIRVDGASVSFTIKGIPGSPTFDGTVDGNTMTGRFTQGGSSFPFELQRDATVEAEVETGRPQDPEPPFPYTTEEVTYERGGVTLAATLTIPEGEGPFPAALLLTGSGAQDRDESLLGHRPFLVLADHLARAGIATLRADDRGVGGSTGSLAETTLDDLAGDALGGVAFLRGHRAIDSKKIGIIGHSEGGIVGPLAAVRSSSVGFLVLLAGPGVPGSDILRVQTRQALEQAGLDQERIDGELELLDRGLTLLQSDASTEDLIEQLREIAQAQLELMSDAERESIDVEANLEARLAQVSSKWFRSFASNDPAVALRQVTVPVLAMNGELDVQVESSTNLAAIEAALAEAGNDDVTIESLPQLNHLFQTARTGAVAEYAQIEETFAPAALELISGWIRARFVE